MIYPHEVTAEGEFEISGSITAWARSETLGGDPRGDERRPLPGVYPVKSEISVRQVVDPDEADARGIGSVAEQLVVIDAGEDLIVRPTDGTFTRAS